MANTLTVRLAEDAWNGDAQFTVDVDGVRIAGPTSVTTLHGAGFQEFTYTGDYGAGPHTVAVHFINDAWGGTASTDRNLYVDGIIFDGTAYDGQTARNDAANGGPDSDPTAAEMRINGTTTFTNVVDGSSPPPPTSGSDTLVLHLSEDAWNGDAQFAVLLDGVQMGGPTAVTTAHGSGVQDFTYTGNFGAGPHKVEVRFLNDAWGGTASTDRNLYVHGITFDGIDHAGQDAGNTARNGMPDTDPNAAEMYVNGSVVFGNVAGSAGGGGPTGAGSDVGTGANHIVGTDGNDNLPGTAANDFTEGLGGADTITGGGGNDTLDGGAGNDQITVSSGNNVLTGGDGVDVLTFTGGSDTVTGGAGDDTMKTNSATSGVLTGGDGHDQYYYQFTSTAGGAGALTITDFQAGHGGELFTFMDGYLGNIYGPYSFDAIYSRMTDQPDGSTLLTNDDGSTIRFAHVTRDQFTADNFSSFSTGHPPPYAGGPTATLVLHLSEDAWNGDATFRLLVDGHQITGPTNVTTAHGSGVQDFTYTGQFGTTAHTVAIEFVNDAWGGTTTTDRNLYVAGIDYNGAHFAGQAADNTAFNSGPDVDPNAAEMYGNGTVTFHSVIG
ncbi:MAG: carbohydrate-binding domain-containing protein [Gemmatimonas sp.]